MNRKQTHSVPYFEGDASRWHHDLPLGRLALQAIPATLRHATSFARAQAFAQFVGFPRSGHSLIGSILDAHPDAVIAHELDVMGLIEKAVPLPLIHGMIAHNASDFTANGRTWNGLSYTIEGGSHGVAGRPLVVGDKKGDWAVRRCAQDFALLDQARKILRNRDRWILVVRHPADNIATMSLRKGRVYDDLRVATAPRDFGDTLRTAQADGRIVANVLDEMIDDYETLCVTTEKMQRHLPDEAWHTMIYEQFVDHPAEHISALYAFLDLSLDDALIRSGASIVREGRTPSRDRIGWSAAQEDRVAAIIERFEFLAAYR